MILPVEYPGGSYDIVLERGALARAAEYLPRTGKALIVTDDGVPAAYARQIASVCPGSTIVALPQGEKTKSLDNHRALLSRMLELNFLRTDRVIAVGGGGVLDIAKLLVLQHVTPILDLYDGKLPLQKARDLVLLPTTCGTGSEVTNISILALLSRRTKKGLAHESMFADQAVLIPELLKGLPFSVFATSSIDALIHAIESSLSPKASATTKLFGYQAIAWILKGYLAIRDQGPDARFPLLSQFLLASNYAGIAFGNAGCAAVHALSYPLGAVYHVPHGESNYAMFTGVMKQYLAIRSDGAIAELNAFLAQLLDCPPEAVYEALEDLLSCLLPKKALHEYGMQEHELAEFTDSVLANQQRLLQNNFVPLSREQIYAIYRSLY